MTKTASQGKLESEKTKQKDSCMLIRTASYRCVQLWAKHQSCINQLHKATLPCQLVKLVPDKQLNAVTSDVWPGGDQGSELNLILQRCMQIARLLQSLQGGSASLAAA